MTIAASRRRRSDGPRRSYGSCNQGRGPQRYNNQDPLTPLHRLNRKLVPTTMEKDGRSRSNGNPGWSNGCRTPRATASTQVVAIPRGPVNIAQLKANRGAIPSGSCLRMSGGNASRPPQPDQFLNWADCGGSERTVDSKRTPGRAGPIGAGAPRSICSTSISSALCQ